MQWQLVSCWLRRILKITINPIYAIGDVHGCFDEAKCAVERIKQYHTSNNLPNNPRIIWLGDLTDRGPKSKDVIEFILNRGDECVMGNHDHALFVSCRNPSYLNAWMKWGGGETLLSYGHDVESLIKVFEQMNNGQEYDQKLIDTSIIPSDRKSVV